ncbi:MAG: MFS transporter [Chloroflexota bacterium]|jgi:predicted MFS family arabinose efflux permease
MTDKDDATTGATGEESTGRESGSGRSRTFRLGGLWRQKDFMRLWTGQSISEFGSWLGALSLLAILVLNATPAQMGILETLRAVPALLIGLFAGVWVDRRHRRPLLIGADIGRAVILGLVALVAIAGLAQMAHLYVAALVIGSLTVLFNLAYHSYVPGLVRREQLVEANSKLGATASLAEIASPGLGGLLVQILSAPFTLLLDAVSFLVSALFVSSIGERESRPQPGTMNGGLWGEILTGLRLVTSHPLLRATAGASATRSFFGGFFAALYSLFVLREVGLSPAVLGLLIGAGGLGSFFGAVFAGRYNRRLGWGKGLIVASLASSMLALLIPLASGPPLVAASILLASQLIGDAFLAIYFIGELSLRQTITPDHLLGRTNASFEFLVGGIGAAGILTGGLTGQVLGLRPATAVAAIGMVCAFLWLLLSPLRGLDDLDSWRIDDPPPPLSDLQ